MGNWQVSIADKVYFFNINKLKKQVRLDVMFCKTVVYVKKSFAQVKRKLNPEQLTLNVM